VSRFKSGTIKATAFRRLWQPCPSSIGRKTDKCVFVRILFSTHLKLFSAFSFEPFRCADFTLLIGEATHQNKKLMKDFVREARQFALRKARSF
jgi:hypothetical protein